MEKVDQSIVSIFKSTGEEPEVTRAMRDMISLAGVMKELSTAAVFDNPLEMLRFLRVIEFIQEGSVGVTEAIDSTETLYYRYQNRYPTGETVSKERIEQIVNVLTKNNWVSKQANQIKMMSVGKRMMDAITRLANDSLAYYSEDEIGRSLFQARRDIEISEAYDDKGISGGNRIASLTQNVIDSIELLKERELELLADRNALPQLIAINELMNELGDKLDKRVEAFDTLEESAILSRLMQNATAALTEGTNLSFGMINKYSQFITVQQTVLETVISPEKVRMYIAKMFNPPLESEIPNAHQLFSFMEQGQYEDEALDGMWIPVKYASPLSYASVEKGVHFLENYEPVVEELEEVIETAFNENLMEFASLANVVDEAKWLLTKASIDTEKIEAYLEERHEAELEETMIETSSDGWSDAIRQLLGVAALEANKKVSVGPKEHVKNYEKEWEWIRDDDRKSSIRRRK